MEFDYYFPSETFVVLTADQFVGWRDPVPGDPERGTPRKIRWGCAARFLKPTPYLRPKTAVFPTLFMT